MNIPISPQRTLRSQRLFDGRGDVTVLHYNVVLIPNDSEPGYTVTVPALPGCVSCGESFEEALENNKDAIALYIQDCLKHGEVAPEDRGVAVKVTVEV